MTKLFKLILFFVLLTISNSLLALDIVHYNSDMAAYIGKEITFLEDPEGQLTIHNVLNEDIKFERSTGDVPNFGITKSVYWLKFDVLNDSKCRDLILNLENPLLNYAKLYIVKANSVVDSVCVSGDWINKAFNHQFYTFNLLMDDGDSYTYYVKVKSDMQLLVPVSIDNRDNTINKLLFFDLRTGLFVGIMLAMLVYNMFLYISARDRQYLYYVNYIFWVTVAQAALVGLFHRFLPSYHPVTTFVVPFSGAMSGIASVLFVRSFLSINEYTKRFSIYLNIIIIADVLAILLLFVDVSLAYRLVNLVAGLGSFLVLIIAFYVKRKGNKVAGLFLIAWGIFLSSVIIFVLKDLGVLKYSQFTAYVVQLGVCIEAMLLSFALGNKINTYRKEKEESQVREFNALRENERLIREQNEMLEVKIEERTHELQVTNESLEVTLQELKEAQSQLVESEKMASLGQLTAGVAHEINNPINFVTSNVKPLRRDLDMVWDALSYIEKIAYTEGLDIDQKRNQITAYKKQLDLEYLKSEIEFLLRGMHDGASRTAEIVKSLRVFSRVDEDSVMRADVNLGIESTLVIIGSLLVDNIQVEKKMGNIPHIECYPGKLNQVFLNIFTNAVYAIEKKYSGKVGGLLKIETSHLKEEKQIEIIIEDNGIGIPSEIVNKIFDPFFTTKDVGEGTGLGMSIAYNTIAKHNGEIKIDSTVGEKTIFIIKLPVNQI